MNTSGTQTIKSENNIPSIINDLALNKFTDPKPLKWRGGRVFPREDLACTKFTLCIFLPSEKAMAPHSSTLAWKIPWMEEPDRLQSMGSRRVGHDWETSLSLFTFMHWRRKWQPTPVFLPEESQGWGSLVGCRLWGRTKSDTIFLPAWPKRSVVFYQGCCATLGQRIEIFGGLSFGSEMLLIPGDQNVTGLSGQSQRTMEVTWSRCVSSGLSHSGSSCPPTTLWLSPVPGQVYSAVGRTLHCFSDLCSGSYYGRKTPWAKTRCPWTSVFRLYAGPSDSHGPISLCCVFSTDSGRLKTCVCLSYSQVLKNSGRYHLASIFSNSTEVSSASSPPPSRFCSVPRRQRGCWILSSPLTSLL